MNFLAKLITVVFGITLLVFVSFLLSWPVYMLWNGCLVDAVTGVKEVTWLQAWGLNVLFGIMFNAGYSRNK